MRGALPKPNYKSDVSCDTKQESWKDVPFPPSRQSMSIGSAGTNSSTVSLVSGLGRYRRQLVAMDDRCPRTGAVMVRRNCS